MPVSSVNSDREKAQELCALIGHHWHESYYGYECENCGEFIPYGCAPWDDDGDDTTPDAYYEMLADSWS